MLFVCRRSRESFSSLLVFSALVMFVGTLLVGLPPAAAQQKSPKFIKYVVKPGDDCTKILRKVYGNKDYNLIHRYNKLGPTPHHLKVGSVLRLPAPTPSGPDALLTGVNGKVQTRPPAKPKWTPAQRGAELYSAWRVNSLQQASAEITFQDDSLLYMRENTIVIIYGPASKSARRTTRRAELKTGALRTFVAGGDTKEAKHAGGLTVTSEAMIAELGATAALLTVDSEGMTRVANHGGDPIAVSARSAGKTVKRRKRRAAKRVNQGYGTRAKPGQPIEEPRLLPAPPAWTSGEPRAFGTVGELGTVSASWTPHSTDAKVRVEITRDPAGRDLLRSVEVPVTVHHFEIQGLAPGRYYATVSAIDATGLEGKASSPITLELQKIALKVLGPAREDGKVWVGSVLEPSSGVTCEDRGGDRAARVVLTAVGEVALSCWLGEQRLAMPSLSVVLPPVGSKQVPDQINVGEPTVFSLTVPAAIEGIEVLPMSGPATVSELERHGDELSFRVTTSAPGPVTLGVQAAVANTPIPLETLSLTSVAADVPEPVESHLWLAGGWAAAGLVPSATAYGDAIETMPRFGATLGIQPWSSLGFELDAGVAITPLADSASSRRLAFARAMVRARLADWALEPSLVLGAGQERFVDRDHMATNLGYFGLGLRHWLDDGVVGLEVQGLGSSTLDASPTFALTELRFGIVRAF